MAQMTMIRALMQYLTSINELTDLVSVDTDTGTPNICPSYVTQGTPMPYITILKLADDDTQDLQGRTVHTTITYKITIHSASADTNAEIAEVLRKKLNGFQGPRFMPPDKGLADGAIWVNSVRKTNSFNNPNSPQTGDQYIKNERSEIYDIGIPLDDNEAHPPITI
jgi:uncharacterized protein (UPF0261 family)